ncbi:MAG: CotH kinase family protein [Bacteroidetes bacterium]|nr:CotH kinase family protein [Bacteroidota bacterium]
MICKLYYRITLIQLSLILLTCPAFTQVPKLVINEVMTSNTVTVKDRNNNYSDWVEIYNCGNVAVNLAGMFFTDDENDPLKCRIRNDIPAKTTIPPGSARIFWFDRNPGLGVTHIDMKLGSIKEYIALYAADSVTLIDELRLIDQKTDISYGRKPDGTGGFFYFKKPTPGKVNSTKGFPGFVPEVEIHPNGGFYTDPVTVKLKTGEKADIYYTLDGTNPAAANGILYDKPFEVSRTTVVRAIALIENYLPLNIGTETYFIGESFSLPVVSLATNNYSMFSSTDPGQNIYTESPANVEYYDTTGRCIFNTGAGIRLVGKAIRNYPQKSVSVRFRSSYGVDNIKYRLFDDKEESRYYAFLLRNSGNDWSGTLFKDALMHRLVNGTTHIDCQGYRPAVVFINGNYWGIHNIREKINKYYVVSNHKRIDPENIDMFEFGSLPIQGDQKHWKSLMKIVKNNDLSDDLYYNQVLQMIDVDNFIDYQIAEIFYANCDWPMANMKYWRPHTEGGKWRWILFDTDLAFDKDKRFCPGHNNTLEYALGVNNCHLPHLTNSLKASTVLLRKLMENETFRAQFINRFADLLNTIFETEHVISTIRGLKAGIEREMPRHIGCWKSSGKGIAGMTAWESNIEKMIVFAKERPDTMRRFISNRFSLEGTSTLEVAVNEGGKVKVNTIVPETYPWKGKYFRKNEITLTAIPDNYSYKFIEWSDGVRDRERRLTVKEDIKLEAVFERYTD